MNHIHSARGTECATNGNDGTRYSTARRYSYRVSPSPGRMSKIAYSPCPNNDPQDIEMSTNCLAIPLSAIQTTGNNNKGSYLLFFGYCFFV